MGTNHMYVFATNRQYLPDAERREAVERAALALAPELGVNPVLNEEVKVEWYDPGHPAFHVGLLMPQWVFACPQCEEVVTDDIMDLLESYLGSVGQEDGILTCPACGTASRFSQLTWHGFAVGRVMVTFENTGMLQEGDVSVELGLRKEFVMALPEWKALEEAFGADIDFIEGKH